MPREDQVVRSLRQFTDARFLEILSAAADLMEEELADSLAEALEDLQANIAALPESQRLGPRQILQILQGDFGQQDIPALTEASEPWGDFAGAILDWFGDPSGVAASAFLKSASGALDIITFNGVSKTRLKELATAAARDRSAALVREILPATRNGLRHTITGSFELGERRGPLARKLAEQVGLTERQTAAFTRDLEERIARGEIVSQKGIDQAYRRRVLQRAKVIANHESWTLVNQATRDALAEAKKEGLPVEGLGEVFTSRTGETSEGPTLHVRCKCGTRTRNVEGVYILEWVTQRVNNVPCPRCDAFDGALQGQGAPLPESGERLKEKQDLLRQTEERRRIVESRQAKRTSARSPARSPVPQLSQEEIRERQIQSDMAEIQKAWVHGSRSKTSVHFQEAVRQELGVEAQVWNKRGWKIDDAVVQRYRPAVRRIYEESQRSLRDAGIDRVKLLRGVKTTAVPLRGLMESWTSDLGTAKKFARGGPIMELEFAASRVLMFSGGPGWKNGKYGEQYEWIILGGNFP